MRTFFQFVQAMQPRAFGFRPSANPAGTHALVITQGGQEEGGFEGMTAGELVQLRDQLIAYLHHHLQTPTAAYPPVPPGGAAQGGSQGTNP